MSTGSLRKEKRVSQSSQRVDNELKKETKSLCRAGLRVHRHEFKAYQTQATLSCCWEQVCLVREVDFTRVGVLPKSSKKRGMNKGVGGRKEDI